MNQKVNIKSPKIALPKGGGAIKGMGETFQPNLFTGSGGFSVPLPVSPARGFGPKLSLDYSSGSGNGPFGMGLHLSLPSISIRTEKGFPKYDGEDRYVIAGAEELVPVLNPDNSVHEENTSEEFIRFYRPRTEGMFARIERHTPKSNGTSFWKIISKENITSIYGSSNSSRIYDVNQNTRIFQWLLCESFDSHGNRIEYHYKSENSEAIVASHEEHNRDASNNKYIKSISYGNQTPDARDFLFELIFDYGEHADNPEFAYAESGNWMARTDAFSSFRSGFEIRTHRRCKRVLLFHHFSELKSINAENPFLVKAVDLHYRNENQHSGLSSISFLSSVQLTGYRKFNENGKWFYSSKQLPPIEYRYSVFEPQNALHGFRELKVEGSPVPHVLNKSGFQMIDLNGEGIAGILYSDESSMMYWEPQYDPDTFEGVKFTGPVNVLNFPAERNLQNHQFTLTDVGSDGKLDLLVQGNGRMGFYQQNGISWDPFRSFESQPVIPSDQRLTEQVDLTGDGFADLVLQEQDAVTYYKSLGKKGFAQPVRKSIKQEFPFNHAEGEQVLVRYADLIGDGLQHRVRISKRSVEVWPNLGYGNFGEKITLANAPDFGEDFNPRRILLADIDGTGTADLIYIRSNTIDIYYNDCGNRFAEKISIHTPFPLDDLDMVNSADILGNGNSCLLISGYDSHSQKIKHLYYDFTGGTKPHLLIQTNNNMGAVTRFRYCSSVRFYLRDKANGNPWISRLHFPVQVIEKTESVDYLSESKIISEFSYHHGYYDDEEREFNGFGRVEQIDTPLYEQFSLQHPDEDIPFNRELIQSPELFSPPVKTITWHHTGIFAGKEKISLQLAKEYFNKDERAFQLEDSVFENINDLSAEEIREGCRVLKGTVLRQEVYAIDGSAEQEFPYTVSESNASVKRLQAKGRNRYAVFIAHPETAISYHYERNAADPRIEQSFTLSVDEYGMVTESSKLVYPRRNVPERLAEQEKLHLLYHSEKFIHHDGSDFRLIGISCESQDFEIGGRPASANGFYFSTGEIRAHIHTALLQTLRFEEKINSTQARLLHQSQLFFWDETLNAPLVHGSISAHGLVHHAQETVFSLEHSRELYAAQFSSANALHLELTENGKYHFQENYYWNTGHTQFYFGRDKFFLPQMVEDAWKNRTTEDYDSYSLLPVQTTQYTWNAQDGYIPKFINRVEQIDYQSLSPARLTDPNNNTSEVLLDELGMVITSVQYGDEFDPQSGNFFVAGDDPLSSYTLVRPSTLSELLESPEKYLQGAGHYFYYDLDAFRLRKEPVYAAELVRELAKNNTIPVPLEYHTHAHIVYTDGFGRELQSKHKVESGDAFIHSSPKNLARDSAGKPVIAFSEKRWQVSGRKVYNNKGNPVKQYEPFYTDIPFFESEEETNTVGYTSIIKYDPLQRAIETLLPDGFRTKQVFTPWTLESWDANDLLTEKPDYYEGFIKEEFGEDPESWITNALQDALGKGKDLRELPSVQITNTLGQTVRSIQFPDYDARKSGNGFITENSFDVNGNLLSITDPRQQKKNSLRTEAVRNFSFTYDMQSPEKDEQGKAKEKPRLKTISVDAGTDLAMYDSAGKAMHHWDSRGFHNFSEYDSLHRPKKIKVSGVFLNEDAVNGTIPVQTKTVETFVYGDEGILANNAESNTAYKNAQRNNLMGQLIEHRDQSGIHRTLLFDLGGKPRIAETQLRTEYKKEADWNGNEKTENEIFTAETIYDALERPLFSINYYDGSVQKMEYHQSGKLKASFIHQSPEQIENSSFDRTKYLDAANFKAVVKAIHYNAKDQRERVEYGNETSIRYSYYKRSYRLKQLRTTSSKNIHQDIFYFYDPNGNITCIRDTSHETIFSSNQQVDPESRFRYDGLNRLVEAKGRQHPAFTVPNEISSFDRNSFFEKPPGGNDTLKPERYTQLFTYDEAGNLIRIRHLVNASNRCWTRYMNVADNSNRAVQNRFTENADPETDLSYPLAQADLNSYFDANGNLKTLQFLSGDPDAQNIFWNYRNNIASVNLIERSEKSSDAEFYIYDAAGNRVRKLRERMEYGKITREEKLYLGGLEIKRRYDSENNLLEERQTQQISDDKQHVATRYHWTIGRPEKLSDEPQLRFQYANHLGSASLELSESAELISYEEYFAYGGTSLSCGRNEIEISLKEYRYSGKERDDSTGLYYYGARYYISWLGRWMNPDPIGEKDGVNPWVFVGGNPVGKVDVDGRRGIDVFIHGTDSSSYNRWDNPYARRNVIPAYQNITGNNIAYKDFDWSEHANLTNDVSQREKASDKLIEYLKEKYEKISESDLKTLNNITLIGHSHGGNVAIRTLTKLRTLLDSNNSTSHIKIRLITTATPASDRPDSLENPAKHLDALSRHINIYNELDAVQIFIASIGRISKKIIPWFEVGKNNVFGRTYNNAITQNYRVNVSKYYTSIQTEKFRAELRSKEETIVTTVKDGIGAHGFDYEHPNLLYSIQSFKESEKDYMNGLLIKIKQLNELLKIQ